jgi:hypothetical protein
MNFPLCRARIAAHYGLAKRTGFDSSQKLAKSRERHLAIGAGAARN